MPSEMPTQTYAYWPAVKRNPVLDLLYCEAASAGYKAVPVARDDLWTVDLGPGDVLHVHWVHHIVAGARTSMGARWRRKQFINFLKDLQTRGVRIVWTVHNRLSHDSQFMRQETKLRAQLVQMVDVVHMLNPDTPRQVTDLFAFVPKARFHCPHPSYATLYVPTRDRKDMRCDLGIVPKSKTRLLLTFGEVQQRKGLTRLVQQMPRINAQMDSEVRLLIVGQASQRRFRDSLQQVVGREPQATWQVRFAETAELGNLIQACDAVVCPYRTGLNSGVAVAGASLAKPVVVPQMLAPIFDHRVAVETFDADDDNALGDAAVRALQLPRHNKIRQDWIADHHPSRVSKRFFASLKAAL